MRGEDQRTEAFHRELMRVLRYRQEGLVQGVRVGYERNPAQGLLARIRAAWVQEGIEEAVEAYPHDERMAYVYNELEEVPE